jgi:DNA-directed RNA polymerase specialized sigma24 family protein
VGFLFVSWQNSPIRIERMPLNAETIAAARKLRPAAVTLVLQSEALAVYRLAYALAGRWDVGRGVARFVLQRSVEMMPSWGPEADPSNWYHRFTIMTSRRSAKHQPKPGKDVLIEQALQPDAQYIAYVAALRHLEPQHREAFLLYHCEHLNARYSALAMDCSTQAADTHLRAANESLRLVAGANFDALTRKLADAYTHLTPDPNDMLPTVNGVVFRQVRVRKWFRRVVLLIELVILVGLIWGGWKLYHFVRT